MSISSVAIEKPNKTLFENSTSKPRFFLFRCLRMLIAMTISSLLNLPELAPNRTNSILNAGYQQTLIKRDESNFRGFHYFTEVDASPIAPFEDFTRDKPLASRPFTSQGTAMCLVHVETRRRIRSSGTPFDRPWYCIVLLHGSTGFSRARPLRSSRSRSRPS